VGKKKIVQHDQWSKTDEISYSLLQLEKIGRSLVDDFRTFELPAIDVPGA
jgi:hypothetical protein